MIHGQIEPRGAACLSGKTKLVRVSGLCYYRSMAKEKEKVTPIVRVKVKSATEVRELLLKSAEADRLSTSVYVRMKPSQRREFTTLSEALGIKSAELGRLLCLSAMRVPRNTLLKFLKE